METNVINGKVVEKELKKKEKEEARKRVKSQKSDTKSLKRKRASRRCSLY